MSLETRIGARSSLLGSRDETIECSGRDEAFPLFGTFGQYAASSYETALDVPSRRYHYSIVARWN